MKRYIDNETGEKKAFGNLQVYAEVENTNERQFLGNFDSFNQILEYYEDYIPKEPLIKDEKIRKAVRAWAEANNVTKVWHEGSSVGFCDGAVSIKFHELCWEEIPKGEYTIEELCGEKEE